MDARTDPRRLEEVLLNATAPREQVLFDGWLVRLSREHIKRASSVNAYAASRLPLGERIETCERMYRDRGLPPLFRLTSMDESGLDDELARRGYRRFEPSLTLVAPEMRPPKDLLPSGLRFEEPDLQAWVATVARLRGWEDDDARAHFGRVSSSVLPSYCLWLLASGQVASCGLVTVDGEYAGLFDVYTEPLYRGQGLATALCGRLLAIGRDHGASIGWLSVLDDNGPALAVYRKLGFEKAYEYWYRVPPDYQAG